MKPVKAWAVLSPNQLSHLGWKLPVYRTLDEARETLTEWKAAFPRARIVRVEIHEVPSTRGRKQGR